MEYVYVIENSRGQGPESERRRDSGDAGAKESGNTDKTAAVKLVRFAGAPPDKLWLELSDERRSSCSEITLQSSLGAPRTDPLEL